MSRPAPKNVIWITTDHMRYDCIGAHGNAAMHTPNLDFLVEHGVSFHSCFAQNPVSMPSRASFMTGLYPQQTGVTTNGHVLPADFPLVPARLFARGDYQAAQIGKLHFQEHEDSDLDPRARHDYGFDVFWIAEEAGCYEDAYMTWLRTEYPELVETFRVPRSTSPERIGEREGRVLDAPW
ncbi:MAG: sulfatase-like hydrolase/transferase, partial [Planctomycetota bacterium]